MKTFEDLISRRIEVGLVTREKQLTEKRDNFGLWFQRKNLQWQGGMEAGTGS